MGGIIGENPVSGALYGVAKKQQQLNSEQTRAIPKAPDDNLNAGLSHMPSYSVQVTPAYVSPLTPDEKTERNTWLAAKVAPSTSTVSNTGTSPYDKLGMNVGDMVLTALSQIGTAAKTAGGVAGNAANLTGIEKIASSTSSIISAEKYADRSFVEHLTT